MQHAVALSGEDEDKVMETTEILDDEQTTTHPTTSEPMKLVLSYAWCGLKNLFYLLRPSTIRSGYNQFRQMTFKDLVKSLFSLFIYCLRLVMMISICALR